MVLVDPSVGASDTIVFLGDHCYSVHPSTRPPSRQFDDDFEDESTLASNNRDFPETISVNCSINNNNNNNKYNFGNYVDPLASSSNLNQFVDVKFLASPVKNSFLIQSDIHQVTSSPCSSSSSSSANSAYTSKATSTVSETEFASNESLCAVEGIPASRNSASTTTMMLMRSDDVSDVGLDDTPSLVKASDQMWQNSMPTPPISPSR